MMMSNGSNNINGSNMYDASIPVAARSKAWVCGRSLAVFVVSVVCCQVEISAMGHHSYRGVVPSVVCLNMIVKPQ